MTHSPLRVLDLTDELAHHGARLFVGLGADVLRPVAGQLERSASWIHWHAGKRTWVSEDLTRDVAALLPGVDIVLESGPLKDLITLSMREENPNQWAHASHVVVTPFGLTGPRSSWTADDLVAASAGGMTWLGGDPGEAPEPPPREQALHLAGAQAATAALLGLIGRRQTGCGQLIEVSVQEAVAATLETGAIAWIHGESVPSRTSGVYGHVAHRVFEAADGFLAGGYSGSNRMWDDLLAWMVEADAAADLSNPEWQDVGHRWADRPHVDEIVSRFVKARSAKDFAEEARSRSLPWAEVVSPAHLPANPQLRSRNFFVEIDATEPLIDVGFPFETQLAPRPRQLRTPDPCQQRPEWHRRVAREPAKREERRPITKTTVQSGALRGLRVLDLTWVLAGPYATKTLADHGAEIIKIESLHRQDPTRFSPGMRLRPGAGYDESGYFVNFNRNKASVCLNLRQPRAVEILRDLVSEVDMVVENFSPNVLAKWGMAYEQLRELNPNIILVSMSGVGHDGPWRQAVTFADTLAAMSGLTFETGLRAGRPQGLTFGLGDMVAANAAVLGALDLVLAGTGGHVDLSQLEAMASQLGTAVIENQIDGEEPMAESTRPIVLRARGEDRWVAVGATNRSAIARAASSCAGRKVWEGEAEAALRDLASRSDADEFATALQAHGVPSYPVRDGRDLVELDSQLRAREFYVELEHPTVGRVLHEGLAIHLSQTPGGVAAPSPLLGEHTDEVLNALLGLDAEELGSLRQTGVLE